MWPLKKQEKEKELPTPIVEEKPKPKPTTRMAIMKIVIINNKTDYTHVIESENDYGLTWFNNYKAPNRVTIQQKLDVNGNACYTVADLYGFSLINIKWITFDILPDDACSSPTDGIYSFLM
jgi:hypothetical protein